MGPIHGCDRYVFALKSSEMSFSVNTNHHNGLGLPFELVGRTLSIVGLLFGSCDLVFCEQFIVERSLSLGIPFESAECKVLSQSQI